MRKIIIIGELSVDIPIGADGVPGQLRPGGRLLNAACILGSQGLPVEMVGDMGSDPMGDIVERFLESNHVGTSSVDRYTDGLTPVTFYFGDKGVRYATNPADGLDVVWPRVDQGDIVVFGGYYAIDPRVRSRLTQLLNYAAERHCLLVYLPGFLPSLAPRITRVMPSLLENMEMASLVVTRQSDLSLIYGADGADPDKCYRNHVFYYTPAMVNVDPAQGSMTVYAGTKSAKSALPGADTSLQWMARFVATLVSRLYATEGEVSEQTLLALNS